MSSRRLKIVVRPKVEVRPGAWAGQYIAWCYECDWAMANSGKTYIEDRARAHRAQHRQEAAARGE